MDESNARLDPLDVLATEFTARQRQGECPTIGEYVERYPELAEEIRLLFPTIARLEKQKVSRQRAANGSVLLAGRQLERLGDFRIVCELGRGGMGIVYESEQQSLARRVAIKVLPRQSLVDSRQLGRFQREANTAASLHHTNIVPVFGIGEEDGYHYIVMQLIRGMGLDKVLAQLADSPSAESTQTDGLATKVSSPVLPSLEDVEETSVNAGAAEVSDPMQVGPAHWRNVARIGIQVADALDYAHQRGVLHRDIKPSNLIVDQQGSVWVTDFGLAKAMEGDSLSRTGDVVGTLQYMAPEQLQGDTDARSDVYSLGLTLYESLALQLAYKAPDPSSLMRKIAQESPRRLASVAPGIPRDLETIVMKAVSREPEHRYQSAGELADDLRLLLEDRPIRARRISSAEHLWRWCRRNRVVAGLAATALSLLVLVAVVASIGYVRTNNALAGESQQRRKADSTSRLAIEALDDIFEQFAPERLSSSADPSGSGLQVPVQPVLSKEAASLLERLLVFYDRLATEGSGDVLLRRKSADANRRVGDIRAALGQFEQAQAAYLTAIDTYGQIEERLSAGDSIAVEIARIYNSLGELQIPAGSPHESRSFHVKALETLDRATTTKASPAVRFETARTCYWLGQDAGAPPVTIGSPPPRPGRHGGPPPGGPPDMMADGPPPFSGGPWQPPPGGPGHQPEPFQRDENKQFLLRAVELLGGLVEEQPTIPDYQHLLARCCRDLPPAWPPAPDTESSGQTDRAIEILEKLVETHRGVPAYRADLVDSYLRASSQFDPGSHAWAENRLQLQKALRVARELVAEHPNVPRYLLSQVQVHVALAEMCRRESLPDDAERELREALRLQALSVSRFPGNVPSQIWLAMIQNSLAELLIERGQMMQARTLLEESTVMLMAIPDVDHGGAGAHVRLLHQSYENLTYVYAELGQEDLADEASRQAEQYRDGRPGPPGRPRD
jgi:serine/threonine protein kinase